MAISHIISADTATLNEFWSVNAQVSLLTTPVRRNGRALRFNATTLTAQAAIRQRLAGGTFPSVYQSARMYVQFGSLPSAVANFISFRNAAGTQYQRVQMTTTGAIQILDNTGATVGTSVNTVSLNTWYRVDIDVGYNSGLGIRVYVNGTLWINADTAAVTLVSSGNLQEALLGWVTNTTWNVTMDDLVFYDSALPTKSFTIPVAGASNPSIVGSGIATSATAGVAPVLASSRVAVAGNLLVGILASRAGVALTVPAGYVLLGDSGAVNANRRISLVGKVAAGGETSVTLDDTVATRKTGYLYEIANVDADAIVSRAISLNIRFKSPSPVSTTVNTITSEAIDPSYAGGVLFFHITDPASSDGGGRTADAPFTIDLQDGAGHSFSSVYTATNPGSTSATHSWTTAQQVTDVIFAVPGMAASDDLGDYEVQLSRPINDVAIGGWKRQDNATLTQLFEALNSTPPAGTTAVTGSNRVENIVSSTTDNLDVQCAPYSEIVEVHDGTTAVNFGSTGQPKVGQKFTVPAGIYKVRGAWVKLDRAAGALADNIKVSLQTDSGGFPSGTELASVTVAASTLTATPKSVQFDFGSDVAVTPSTVYHIVLERSGALHATDFPRTYSAGDVYSGGNGVFYNGTSWSASAADYTMSVYASEGTFDIIAVQPVANTAQEVTTGSPKAGALNFAGNPAAVTEQSFDFGLPNGNAGSVTAAAMGTNPAGWGTVWGPVVETPGVGAVTDATGPTVRVGKRAATTREVDVDFLGVYIMREILPPPVAKSGTDTLTTSITDASSAPTITDFKTASDTLTASATDSIANLSIDSTQAARLLIRWPLQFGTDTGYPELPVLKSATDTLTSVITDVADRVVLVSTSDTLTSVVTDALGSVVATLTASDTLTTSITDVVASLVASLSRTDNPTISVSDVATAIAAVIAAIDTLTVSLGDTPGQAVVVAATDTLTSTITEGRSVLVDRSTTDTLTSTITEARAQAVVNNAADDVAIGVTETAVVTVIFAATDTVTIGITDAAGNPSVVVNAVDTLTTQLAETAQDRFVTRSTTDTLTSVINDASQPPAAVILATDTTTIGLVDNTGTLAGFLNRNDDVSVSLAEATASGTSNVSGSDTPTIGITESVAIAVTTSTTDTVAAAISETSALLKTITASDTLTSTITEGRTVAGIVNVSDTVSVAVTENTAPTAETRDVTGFFPAEFPIPWGQDYPAFIYKTATDTLTVQLGLEDSNAGNTQYKSAVDTLTTVITDVMTGLALPAADNPTISVTEARTIVVSVSATDTLTSVVTEGRTQSVVLSRTDTLTALFSSETSFIPSITTFKSATDTLTSVITDAKVGVVTVVNTTDGINVSITDARVSAHQTVYVGSIPSAESVPYPTIPEISQRWVLLVEAWRGMAVAHQPYMKLVNDPPEIRIVGQSYAKLVRGQPYLVVLSPSRSELVESYA